MQEIMRDPVWQFIVLAALALAAVVVSILLLWMQRRRKALSYEIISRTPLLSVEEEVKGKLQILFDDKPVQDVYLVVARIINTGNVPIVSTDYEDPVNLSFGENSQILTIDSSETNPDSLRVSTSIEKAKVVLAPILLNRGDSITIKMLISQFDDEIKVDGHIAGVKSIQKLVEGRFQNYILMMSGMVISLVGLTLLGQANPPRPPISEKLTQNWPYMILFILGYALVLIGSFRLTRFWKKVVRLFR
jgi:hypothetical protein